MDISQKSPMEVRSLLESKINPKNPASLLILDIQSKTKAINYRLFYEVKAPTSDRFSII